MTTLAERLPPKISEFDPITPGEKRVNVDLYRRIASIARRNTKLDFVSTNFKLKDDVENKPVLLDSFELIFAKRKEELSDRNILGFIPRGFKDIHSVAVIKIKRKGDPILVCYAFNSDGQAAKITEEDPRGRDAYEMGLNLSEGRVSQGGVDELNDILPFANREDCL